MNHSERVSAFVKALSTELELITGSDSTTLKEAARHKLGTSDMEMAVRRILNENNWSLSER